MRTPAAPSEILTIRVPRDLARRLRREARRRRRPRSVVARELLEAGLADALHDPMAEARRQSLLVRERESEREAIGFIMNAVDLQGWR
ncbi:MAG: ribbon-helix-helix protein, CopG family [Vicinamibacterales bacterium]